MQMNGHVKYAIVYINMNIFIIESFPLTSHRDEKNVFFLSLHLQTQYIKITHSFYTNLKYLTQYISAQILSQNHL